MQSTETAHFGSVRLMLQHKINNHYQLHNSQSFPTSPMPCCGGKGLRLGQFLDPPSLTSRTKPAIILSFTSGYWTISHQKEQQWQLWQHFACLWRHTKTPSQARASTTLPKDQHQDTVPGKAFRDLSPKMDRKLAHHLVGFPIVLFRA